MSSPGDHLGDRHQETPAKQTSLQCQGLNSLKGRLLQARHRCAVGLRAWGQHDKSWLCKLQASQDAPAPQLESARGAGLASGGMQEARDSREQIPEAIEETAQHRGDGQVGSDIDAHDACGDECLIAVTLAVWQGGDAGCKRSSRTVAVGCGWLHSFQAESQAGAMPPCMSLAINTHHRRS